MYYTCSLTYNGVMPRYNYHEYNEQQGHTLEIDLQALCSVAQSYSGILAAFLSSPHVQWLVGTVTQPCPAPQSVLVCFPVAVTNPMTFQKQPEDERVYLFHLTGYSPSLRGVRKGAQSKNLEKPSGNTTSWLALIAF